MTDHPNTTAATAEAPMSPVRHQQPPRLTWHDAAAVGVLVLLTLAFFWKMAFTDLILPRGDTFTYFYPYWAARSAAVQAGRLPLWNPDLFMGAPFLGNSQAGVLYPLNWILSWLNTPTAVKAALIFHTAWAAVGMYLFARRSLRLSLLGSLLAGAVFALGGYFTAQAEHINQLQGLAWLPWLFWLWSEAVNGRPKFVLLLGLAFGMQLLAGHTQSAFISGVGLGVWALWRIGVRWFGRVRRWQPLAWPLAGVALGALIAAGLAAPQLLPTFELTSLSNRHGGLPFSEAVSFSLHPALVGRAFLPAYDTPLFSEYVATIGVIGLALALAGLWLGWIDWRVRGMAALAALGGFFALGAYNPVYWLLVDFAPGFGLFRAPARWLVLTALGLAALAGAGHDALPLADRKQRRTLAALTAALVLILAGWSFAAPLAGDVIQGAIRPLPGELIGWAAALLLALGAMYLPFAQKWPGSIRSSLLAALVLVEMFMAARVLPYNQLSAPEAWSSQRPSISALLAATNGQTPPARFLALSDITFDPGDMREMQAIYGPVLSDDALYDYIIASKLKEVLSPNLSMVWGLPSMDGFDGGVLPTEDTIRFTALFLDNEDAVDGRLREYLDEVPPLEWLQIANVRYIITDKVADVWIGDVYYDLTFPVSRAAGESAPIEAHPAQPFTATAVGLVGSAVGESLIQPETPIATLAAITPDGAIIEESPLLAGQFTGGDDGRAQTVVTWGEPAEVGHVEIRLVDGFAGVLTVEGVSIIDTRSGAFLPTTLSDDGSLRLMQSGDVKIYEYNGTLPRASLVCAPEIVAGDDAAFEHLAASPTTPVIVGGQQAATPTCDANNPGTATITNYEPESVTVSVDGSGAGLYLILRDQWYPGWQVSIDGGDEVVPHKANGLFRAVPVPEGEHTVTFTYHSRPLRTGLLISAGTALATVIALLVKWPGNQPSILPDQPA